MNQTNLKVSADDKIEWMLELELAMEKAELWEKKKMIGIGIFSFSHNVFKRLLCQALIQ